MDSLALGLLVIVSIIGALLPKLQRARFEAEKPPLDLMERYLGPAYEWDHLPLPELAVRFRERGWDVKDSDGVLESFRKIKEGRLERLG